MKFLKKKLFYILLFITSISFAQGGPGGNCDPGLCAAVDGSCGPCDVPIDGGASLLLIAGGVYGINKIRKYRKLKSN